VGGLLSGFFDTQNVPFEQVVGEALAYFQQCQTTDTVNALKAITIWRQCGMSGITPGKVNTRYGGFLDQVDCFDANLAAGFPVFAEAFDAVGVLVAGVSSSAPSHQSAKSSS
jgi:hypothetical protein